jgi:hypothetical protein
MWELRKIRAEWQNQRLNAVCLCLLRASHGANGVLTHFDIWVELLFLYNFKSYVAVVPSQI